jgi:hypothetical protein
MFFSSGQEPPPRFPRLREWKQPDSLYLTCRASILRYKRAGSSCIPPSSSTGRNPTLHRPGLEDGPMLTGRHPARRGPRCALGFRSGASAHSGTMAHQRYRDQTVRHSPPLQCRLRLGDPDAGRAILPTTGAATRATRRIPLNKLRKNCGWITCPPSSTAYNGPERYPCWAPSSAVPAVNPGILNRRLLAPDRRDVPCFLGLMFACSEAD